LRRVATLRDGLWGLNRAIDQFPSSIRLRVERATLLIALNEKQKAHKDCEEAIKITPTLEAAYPFEVSEDYKEALYYEQGAAFWLLGRRPESEDRFGMSELSPETHYSHVMPEYFGLAQG
jgi:hypothetical protein